MSRVTGAFLRGKLFTHQVIPTQKLKTWLEQYGFHTRAPRGGSTHVTVIHPSFEDIDPFTIVLETGKIDSQKKVIKACLQVLELEADGQEAPANGLALGEVFDQSTHAPSNLPPGPYRLITSPNGALHYLQRTDYPQILTLIPGYTATLDMPSMNMYADYLDKRVQATEALINRACTEYHFECTRYPNGTIILNHPVYPEDCVLYAVTPRQLDNDDENNKPLLTVHSKIKASIKEVQDWKESTDFLLEVVLNGYQGKESGIDDKGRHLYHFNCYGQPVTMRCDMVGDMMFYEQIMAPLFDLFSTIRTNLKSKFRRDLGVEVKRSPDGKFLLFSHPLYPDLSDIEVPDMPLTTLTSNALYASMELPREQRNQKLEQYQAFIKNFIAMMEDINAFTTLVNDEAHKSMEALNKEFGEQDKPQLPGTAAEFRRHNAEVRWLSFKYRGQTIRTRGMTTYNSRDRSVFVFLNKDGLEQLLAEARAIRAQQAALSSQASSLSVLQKKFQKSDHGRPGDDLFRMLQPNSPLSGLEDLPLPIPVTK